MARGILGRVSAAEFAPFPMTRAPFKPLFNAKQPAPANLTIVLLLSFGLGRRGPFFRPQLDRFLLHPLRRPRIRRRWSRAHRAPSSRGEYRVVFPTTFYESDAPHAHTLREIAVGRAASDAAVSLHNGMGDDVRPDPRPDGLRQLLLHAPAQPAAVGRTLVPTMNTPARPACPSSSVTASGPAPFAKLPPPCSAPHSPSRASHLVIVGIMPQKVFRNPDRPEPRRLASAQRANRCSPTKIPHRPRPRPSLSPSSTRLQSGVTLAQAQQEFRCCSIVRCR